MRKTSFPVRRRRILDGRFKIPRWLFSNKATFNQPSDPTPSAFETAKLRPRPAHSGEEYRCPSFTPRLVRSRANFIQSSSGENRSPVSPSARTFAPLNRSEFRPNLITLSGSNGNRKNYSFAVGVLLVENKERTPHAQVLLAKFGTTFIPSLR